MALARSVANHIRVGSTSSDFYNSISVLSVGVDAVQRVILSTVLHHRFSSRGMPSLPVQIVRRCRLCHSQHIHPLRMAQTTPHLAIARHTHLTSAQLKLAKPDSVLRLGKFDCTLIGMTSLHAPIS